MSASAGARSASSLRPKSLEADDTWHAKRAAFEAGIIERMATPIHELDWNVIADAIDVMRGEDPSR